MSFQPAPRKKIALDSPLMKLSAPIPNQQKGRSSLVWGLRRNSVAITVWTGFDDDQNNDKGKIEAVLEGVVFSAFLELLNDAIAAPGVFKDHVTYRDYSWYNRQRSQDREEKAHVYVGKDEDGTIWMSVVDAKKKERPRIKFVFGGGPNYQFKHGDGSDYTRGQTSNLFARAYLRMLSEIGHHYLVTEYKEPERKDNAGGGNRQGGGYNGGGNRGGGSNNDTYEEDIPF